MTADEYTPSLDRAKAGYVEWRQSRGGKKYPDEYEAEFDRMIEAVRREEREKAVQIVKTFESTTGLLDDEGASVAADIAARILEQGS